MTTTFDSLSAGDAIDDRLRRRPSEPVQRQPGDDRVVGEGGDVDHHRHEAGVTDELGVALHHVLLGSYQQDLHLPGADDEVDAGGRPPPVSDG
mgnify:CR=1 FL=1